MILSHKHKFIFIKTNKTAGTSIEIALSKFCGPDDIITPISAEDEKTRKELGYVGPQNYETDGFEFYNHMPASELKAQISADIWDNYFKFCFVRNPWDRVISHYYFTYQEEPRPAVSSFVNSKRPRRLMNGGFDLYTIDGQIVVDRVCRYEKIGDELNTIAEELGFGETVALPRAKSRFRQDKRSYRELMDEADQAKVAEIFADEIRLFGYAF